MCVVNSWGASFFILAPEPSESPCTTLSLAPTSGHVHRRPTLSFPTSSAPVRPSVSVANCCGSVWCLCTRLKPELPPDSLFSSSDQTQLLPPVRWIHESVIILSSSSVSCVSDTSLALYLFPLLVLFCQSLGPPTCHLSSSSGLDRALWSYPLVFLNM